MHTDGNALGGLLREIFTAELTGALRTCETCGAQRPIGAHRLYAGAGYVLRCPECGDLAAVVCERADGYALSLRGTWLLGRAP